VNTESVACAGTIRTLVDDVIEYLKAEEQKKAEAAGPDSAVKRAATRMVAQCAQAEKKVKQPNVKLVSGPELVPFVEEITISEDPADAVPVVPEDPPPVVNGVFTWTNFPDPKLTEEEITDL
jgi:alkylation response protein AidB-like acyl-CoA dehydrogenase